MMSERAVRATEAAAAAASASAQAVQTRRRPGSRRPGSAAPVGVPLGILRRLGVLIAYVSYLVLDTIRDTLVLIAIATLLAIGLDPLVSLLDPAGACGAESGVAIVFLGLLVRDRRGDLRDHPADRQRGRLVRRLPCRS